MAATSDKHLKKVPTGAPRLIPRLICRNPLDAIDFYGRVFSAAERVRRPGPDGSVAHAMILIGEAMVMIEAEWPEIPNRAPQLDGSSPVVMYLYVDDVDDTIDKALASGARLLQPLTDQFWGDRTASIMDPSGHVWTVASRIEETTEEQRKSRWSNILGEKNSDNL